MRPDWGERADAYHERQRRKWVGKLVSARTLAPAWSDADGVGQMSFLLDQQELALAVGFCAGDMNRVLVVGAGGVGWVYDKLLRVVG